MYVKVFTEALLHMALNGAGPTAAYGEDVGLLPLENEAESVAGLAGRTEASTGPQSGAGAAR